MVCAISSLIMKIFKHILFRGIEHICVKTPLLKRLYWRTAPSYFKKKYNNKIETQHMKTLKLIHVDPNDIIHFSGREIVLGGERRENIGLKLDGDWDKNKRELQDGLIFKSVKDRYNKNIQWEDTKLYAEVMEKVNNGESFYHGCESETDLINRFMNVDKLFENIKQEGYKTSFERNEPTPYINRFIQEINVDIGRDGEILFVDGRHRLAIAQALGLRSVPVFVIVRHRKWVEKLIKARTGEIQLSHPDLSQNSSNDL